MDLSLKASKKKLLKWALEVGFWRKKFTKIIDPIKSKDYYYIITQKRSKRILDPT